eukprot:6258966-Amphidinium_carterae.2
MLSFLSFTSVSRSVLVLIATQGLIADALHLAKSGTVAVEGILELGLEPIPNGLPLPPTEPLEQLKKALDAQRSAGNTSASKPWKPTDYFHPVDPSDEAQADAAHWAEKMLHSTMTTTRFMMPETEPPVFNTEQREETIPPYLLTSVTTSTPVPFAAQVGKVPLDSADALLTAGGAPAPSPAAPASARMGPPPPPACP